MRHVAVAQVQPHPLDGVQLRRIGWQWHERDVGGNAERVGPVPPGLVEDEHRVDIWSQAGAETLQKDRHGLGGDRRHHQGEVVAGGWADGGIDIGPGEAAVAQAGWALAALVPAVGDAALVAEAGLVLEPQLQPLVGVGQLRLPQRSLQAPFLKRSCAIWSVLG